MSHNLLSLELTAKFLHYSEKELKQLVVAGEIPYFQQGDRYVFEQEKLDNWLSNNLINNEFQKRKKRAERTNDTPIAISSYLQTSGIAPHLSGHSICAILKNLTVLADETGLLYDPDEFYNEIRQREQLSSTAMGNGVALVHPCHRNNYLIQSPFLCLAKADTPVYFGDSNGAKTSIFFVIACEESALHLQILKSLCQLIEKTDLLEDLSLAKTRGELLASIQKAEIQIKNLI
ncbi:MAG: PTS sugar transporter subunit IIA [Lentisphaeria bacterium]